MILVLTDHGLTTKLHCNRMQQDRILYPEQNNMNLPLWNSSPWWKETRKNYSVAAVSACKMRQRKVFTFSAAISFISVTEWQWREKRKTHASGTKTLRPPWLYLWQVSVFSAVTFFNSDWALRDMAASQAFRDALTWCLTVTYSSHRFSAGTTLTQTVCEAAITPHDAKWFSWTGGGHFRVFNPDSGATQSSKKQLRVSQPLVWR